MKKGCKTRLVLCKFFCGLSIVEFLEPLFLTQECEREWVDRFGRRTAYDVIAVRRDTNFKHMVSAFSTKSF